MNDLNEFHATEQAMDAIGFTQDDKNSLFKVCAAILNLGNVEYEHAGMEGCEISGASADAVAWVAFHLCMDEGVLRHHLTHRKIDVNGEVRKMPLLPPPARAQEELAAAARQRSPSLCERSGREQRSARTTSLSCASGAPTTSFF
jgi:myosin heavy subunit